MPHNIISPPYDLEIAENLSINIALDVWMSDRHKFQILKNLS